MNLDAWGFFSFVPAGDALLTLRLCVGGLDKLAQSEKIVNKLSKEAQVQRVKLTEAQVCAVFGPTIPAQ